MTRICDLPPELVGLIFTKIPITSIRTVRSTCTLWKALTKDWGLGIGAAREQYLGLMAMDSKVCSLRFHLRRKNNSKEDEDFLDLSIKQVDLLKGVDIAKIFYCDGLSLCVAKDNSRLVVWNPYLGQTRWIEPRTKFHTLDTYALGYDINRNHKILKFMDSRSFEDKDFFGYELYDFNSHSWRVLDVTSNWHIQDYQRGVSLKGNSYFYAQEKLGHYVASLRGYKIAPNLSSKVRRLPCGRVKISYYESFLLCFDFTRERFGPHLPLPFRSKIGETVALSSFKEEQLAVLYQERKEKNSRILHIWVTTRIEPNTLSWSKFLTVETRPFELSPFSFYVRKAGSFFLDEEKKVVVIFDGGVYQTTKTDRYHTYSVIIGEGGYFKFVSLGEVPYMPENTSQIYSPPLVCSSYFPSLVQLNQSCKRKE